jgi:hypothetical protein
MEKYKTKGKTKTLKPAFPVNHTAIKDSFHQATPMAQGFRRALDRKQAH